MDAISESKSHTSSTVADATSSTKKKDKDDKK